MMASAMCGWSVEHWVMIQTGCGLPGIFPCWLSIDWLVVGIVLCSVGPLSWAGVSSSLVSVDDGNRWSSSSASGVYTCVGPEVCASVVDNAIGSSQIWLSEWPSHSSDPEHAQLTLSGMLGWVGSSWNSSGAQCGGLVAQ